MRNHILAIVLITFLTGVVWLFAETESLGEDRPTGRLRFEGQAGELLVNAGEFDGNISLVLRGSRGAIQRARSILDATLILRPGDPGMPDAEGASQVGLLSLLSQHPELSRTGVIVESVRPQRVDLIVTRLVEHELRIEPIFLDVLADEPISVRPEVARLRVPSDLVPSLSNSAVFARVTEDLLADATQPGPRTAPVQLTLPVAIQSIPSVTLLTQRATVGFTLRGTVITQAFPSVPVQLLLSSAEAQQWDVEIDPEQQLLPLALSGPSDALELLSSPGNRLVAALSLSDVELNRGEREKRVSLVVLRDGVPGPLPDGVSATTELPPIRFTATRRSDEGGE